MIQTSSLSKWRNLHFPQLSRSEVAPLYHAQRERDLAKLRAAMLAAGEDVIPDETGPETEFIPRYVIGINFMSLPA